VKRSSIETGYLVLADLTGFTPFVASAEIDHARLILNDLLGLLRRTLTSSLTLAEVEGDALFLYAPDDRMRHGETLLELIESTYVSFRDRIRLAERNTACPCEACRMIPTLDLKFIVHWGEWMLQETATSVKPFGSCVNLVHRMLKNEVTDATGWRAYALFSDRALDHMGVHPAGMHEQSVEYPHLGSTTIHALGLRARYEELTAARTSYLAGPDAHFTIRRTYPLSRARLWEFMTSLERRNEWEVNADWQEVERTRGRTAQGATNHCARSGFLEELMDWRPFDYWTTELRWRAVRFRVTGELSDAGESTQVEWRMALESVLPGPLRGPACRFFARRMARVPARFEKLDELVAESREAVADGVAGPIRQA